MARIANDDDLNSVNKMVTSESKPNNDLKLLNCDNYKKCKSSSECSSPTNESCNESDSDLVIDINTYSPSSPKNYPNSDCIDLSKFTNGFDTNNKSSNDIDSFKNNMNGPLNLSTGSSNNYSKKKLEPKINNNQFFNALKSFIEINQNFNPNFDYNTKNTDLYESNNPIVPQLVLSSGKLIDGIQQAQVLISSNEGIITQPVLTIPISQINSNNQIVNLSLTNGQIVTTSVANLQAMVKNKQSLFNDLYSNKEKSASCLNGVKTNTKKATDSDQSVLKENHHQHVEKQNGSYSNKSISNSTSNKYSVAQDPHLLNHINNNIKSHTNRNTQNKDLLLTTPINSNTSNNNINICSSSSSSNNMNSSSPVSNCGQNSAVFESLEKTSTNPTINQSQNESLNLTDVKDFAKAFKARRLSLGLTQSQIGQALNIPESPSFSQSAICSALASQMICATQMADHPNQLFEKLDITPKSAEKIKPVLEKLMKEAEEKYHNGQNNLSDYMGMEQSKKRKRRTSFTPQALELLNAHFERNTHPSGTEITGLAHQLGYDREVIRIWFCNKRQALKNTVRLMAKNIS